MTLHVPDNLDPAQLQNHPEPAPGTPQIARQLFASLRRDASGQDLIEYALAAALIGLTAVSGMNGLATNISNAFDGVSNAVANSIQADTPPPDHRHHDRH